MKKNIALLSKILCALILIASCMFALIKLSTLNKATLDPNEATTDSDVKPQLKSGPETSLPWDYDVEFIKSKELNNTPILLGAYKTVLKDPLPGEEFNVHLAARMLSGTVLKPGQVFSQNKTVGPYTEERGFQKGPTYIGSKLSTTIGGGVCKIASTLYNVSVLSNLKIVERHNHSMPVPYVPYGQDATVFYGAKDFKFMNNTDNNIMIWAQGIDNVLYMGFYGISEPPKIEWKHDVLQQYKAEKVYKVNPSLEKGTEKVILEGMDGALIKSWITIENKDGTVTKKDMGISNYSPFPYLIEKGQ
ncbi:MAG: VanW family protein [Bacillota bacterium]|nr:VanW family protein [Bacillota bacterium]